jgi:hypothetical protein
MNNEELLKCIKHINPNAHCVVWEGNKVVYDAAHKGKKPTLKECEDVLHIIAEEMQNEQEKQQENILIKEEQENIFKADAIDSLKKKGKKFKHY